MSQHHPYLAIQFPDVPSFDHCADFTRWPQPVSTSSPTSAPAWIMDKINSEIMERARRAKAALP
jgi:hypothetical protein